MRDWLSELREAHGALAAEGLYAIGEESEAWNRLSALIETGPPVIGLDPLPEIGDKGDLSLTDQRKEVLKALFDAATSGNVTAVLKWLDLHRGQFDEPEVAAPISETGESGSSVDHSDTIKALEDAFMDQSE